MAYEVETKILAVDTESIASRLAELGAEKILETRFTVDWFQEKETQENSEPWFLRIRTTAQGTSEITWKDRSTILGASRKHQEFNVQVNDAAQMAAVLLGIGLECYAHQEKDRVSWRYQDWQFDLDTYPGMPSYLEIEGESEPHIQTAIKLLALEDHATSTEGERKLIQTVYGLNWYDMRFATSS